MIIEDNFYFYHCFIMKNLFHLKFFILLFIIHNLLYSINYYLAVFFFIYIKKEIVVSYYYLNLRKINYRRIFSK
jgi:hypothetical protein